MHALESLHAALRSNGLLLDVRPAPENPVVELVHGGDSTVDSRRGMLLLGHVDDSYRMGTLATADTAVQTLIDAGRFVREQAETFTFIYHFGSKSAWLSYMAEHWSTAHVSAELIARAQEAFSGKTAELRILRTIQAARLRRT